MGQPGAGGPAKPRGEQRAQARQAARRLQRRDEHGLGETGRRVLDRRDLQLLARAEMREQAALGQARALGQAADGQRFEAGRARLRQSGIEDGRAGLFTFAHGEQYERSCFLSNSG